MFLRRVFSRKEQNEAEAPTVDGYSHLSNAIRTPSHNNSPFRSARRNSMPNNDEKQQRSLTMVQLTPLWETIIRTKRLPDNLNVSQIFDEFAERLRDPEWQVRQHALRVLIDVLILMSDRADQYFQPLICPLVENLGHSAPAIRKGALDALKVYMTETAMPETIMLEIISLGMEQTTYFQQFDGRVCIGVMLSMPSFVYTSLGTSKQNHIVRTVIHALTNKMVQVTYQEVALKVLLRIREMIGVREFSEHIAHGAYRDFELLCNVYGLPSTPNTQDPSMDLYLPQTSGETSRVWNPVPTSTDSSNCKVKRTELCWRDKADETSADEENNNNNSSLTTKPFNSCTGNPAEKSCVQTTINVIAKQPENEKIIMETEIKIENTAVTMRIMEASNSNSSENEVAGEMSEDDLSSVYGAQNGVVRIMTDSEMDESNGTTVIEVLDSARNPLKRVTFGGEEVKLRTPDSDSVLQSDNDDAQKAIQKIVEHQLSLNHSQNNLNETMIMSRDHEVNNNLLTVKRPQTASIVITASSPPTSDAESNKQRHKSASPVKRNRRPSYSSADETIVSPKGAHKSIEVLHNLEQRSPSVSPTRSRHNSMVDIKPMEVNDQNTSNETDKIISIVEKPPEATKSNDIIVEEISSPEMTRKHSQEIKSWLNLGLVDELCLRNLKSGDWRLRSNAMCAIEEMLKSTDNLSMVQPHLESLLRTLLSSEKHPDVLEDKRRILVNLISRLPLDNLEDRATQIIVGLCRQGGPGCNRVAKALMQRLPPTAVVIKLISDDFLKAHSSRFRENALQMVLYALMTFPSTYFDIPTCVKKSAEAANDQKKRVRQAALDVLAVLGQISTPKTVLEEVTETLRHEKEAHRLIAAIKARLSRKQLPSVTPEGSVHYALRIPTPPQVISSYYFGADIDWITAGIGSVSPVSSKKRFDPTQMAYNYSSSDSNRSIDHVRRSMRDLSSYNLGSSSEIDNGYPYQKMTPRDDRNTHFVMAAQIPTSQVRYPGSSLQKLNIQSQSFPDLTHRADTKSGPYKPGHNEGSKLSKLPVASRFPSMESNIEARNKNESNYFHGNANRYPVYPNNSSFAMRQNGSLPRKFTTTTSIPVRSDYYNYSHGALTGQSANDESRPSTHPDEYAQPPLPKRFVNVDKYLDESSSESNEPLKTLHDIRYASQLKSPSHEERRLTTEELNRKNAQQSELIALENGGIMNAITPRKPGGIDQNGRENQVDSDGEDVSIIVSEGQRPLSHASTATTRSIQDETSDLASGNRTKSAYSIGQSSIEEIISPKSTAATPKSTIATPISAVATPKSTTENLEVESEAIDTSLEHIQNENNEKLIADESHDVAPVITIDSGHDTIDSAEKTAEIRIDSQPEQLLDAPYISVQKPSSLDDNEPRSESDSISLTSTEESSDYQAMRENTAKTITVPIGEQKIINKPIPKLRPAIISRRNKVTPVKAYPSSASMAPNSKTFHALFPSNLRKFDKPREASNSCLNQLDSPNWETTMHGIQNFVRLIRHHPDTVESHIHAYCVAISKQVKNLRSQVSRSACQASAEFFQTHSKTLETECEDLVTQLFNRTADTNKFLRADALRALAAMCDNLPPTKAIQTILTRGATHQNAIVRTVTANLCSRMVSRLGCEKIYAMNREYRDRLILAGANFLMEGSLDTRNNAKALFKQLSTHPNYNRTLQDVIPPRIYRNIEKALRSIK